MMRQRRNGWHGSGSVTAAGGTRKQQWRSQVAMGLQMGVVAALVMLVTFPSLLTFPGSELDEVCRGLPAAPRPRPAPSANP